MTEKTKKKTPEKQEMKKLVDRSSDIDYDDNTLEKLERKEKKDYEEELLNENQESCVTRY